MKKELCNIIRNTLLIICVVMGVVGCQRGEKKSHLRAIRRVKVIQVGASQLTLSRYFSGKVEGTQETLLSFKLAGRINRLQVVNGQHVAKGDFIASLDDSEFFLALQEMKARLEQAQSNVQLRKVQLAAESKLVQYRNTARLAYDKAKAEYAAALAAVKRVSRSLDLAKDRLENTRLLAPYSGYIAHRYVETHQQVKSGEPIVMLQSDKGFNVKLHLPDALIPHLEVKDTVKVRLPSLGKMQLSGKIIEIASMSDVANTFPVTVEIINPPQHLRAGVYAEVELERQMSTEKSTRFVLPLTAIIPLSESNHEAAVFVYHKESKKVIKTTVTLLPANDTNQIVVNKGLKAGDQVVVAGVHYLHNGERVNLFDNEE